MSFYYKSDLTILAPLMTNAEFQTWLTFIFDSLEVGGLLRTTDTGQINTATVTFPVSNGLTAGYDVRQMNNGMYIRISVLRQGTTNFALVWQMGTGTDGAGNLTGAQDTPRAYVLNVAGTYGLFYTLAIAVSANYFNILNYAYNSGTISVNSGSILCVERTANLDRTWNNRGIQHITHIGTSSLFNGFIPKTGFTPVQDQIGNTAPPYNQTFAVDRNGNTVVFPYNIYGAGEVLPPMLGVLGAFNSQLQDGIIYDVRVRGTIQKMIKVPSNSMTTTHTVRGTIPSALNYQLLVRAE